MPARKPRALLVWRANYLNQAKGNELIFDSLWKDLDLVVDINYCMDTTALYSDRRIMSRVIGSAMGRVRAQEAGVRGQGSGVRGPIA